MDAVLELGHTLRNLVASQFCCLPLAEYSTSTRFRSARICVDQEILINRWWWPGSGRSKVDRWRSVRLLGHGLGLDIEKYFRESSRQTKAVETQ